MAPRYIAIHSSQSTHLLCASALVAGDDFQQIYQSSSLAIFASDDTPFVHVSEMGGVIIGQLFSRTSLTERVSSLDAKLTALQSSSRRIMTDYWGNYVAFFHASDEGIDIIRDPSGAMPAYYMSIGDKTIIGSDVETLVAAGFAPNAIDWSYFPAHFQAFDLRTPQTALEGVTELLAGHCLHLCYTSSSIETYWTPWDYVRPSPRPLNEIEGELFRTIIDCTVALAKTYDRILLGVSGGLDSSVIASALSAGRITPSPFTMATRDPSGDERHYAHQVADAFNFQLDEAFYDLNAVDILRSSACHLPRPLQFAYGQSECNVRFTLAKKYACDAVFSGIGGDNVFCLMQSASPLLDRCLAQGIGLGAFETLRDLCDLTQSSVWQASSMALQRYLKFHPGYIWQPDISFLHPNILANVPFEPSHPWLRAPKGALPGKAAHVAMLTRIQGTIDGQSRIGRPPQVLPLLSQPIVEACLSIPTWEWVAGGQNRSVVRNAFAGSLPEAIVSRRSKRGPTGFSFEVLEQNRNALREVLLDGLLASHGLLDRRAVEDALDSKHTLHGKTDGRLFLFAEAEAWTRHWSSQIRNTQCANTAKRDVKE